MRGDRLNSTYTTEIVEIYLTYIQQSISYNARKTALGSQERRKPESWQPALGRGINDKCADPGHRKRALGG
jgi:hypothetical protein